MQYLIIGSGLYGSTVARILADFGEKVLLIDKRNHIGGNCYTEKIDGIDVHKYGPHCFHTNSEKVWQFLNRFTKFNDFKLQVKVNYNNKIYSFPINLFTLNQLYKIQNPKEAKAFFKKKKKLNIQNNFEEYIISNLGEEIYHLFYKGYTKKQWGKDPADLDVSLAKRIPIRLDYNDFYFTDKYQGVPVDGYTKMFENMLDHPNIKVQLDCDYFENKKDFINHKKVYSGKIDEFFDYKHGFLEYRSLKFDIKKFKKTYQGNSIINYCNESVPYTRITEHKYFSQSNKENTVVSFEYSVNHTDKNIPFYPMMDQKNKESFQKYWDDARKENVLFGGRLGRYTYLNMDQVVAMAMKDCEEKLCQRKI